MNLFQMNKSELEAFKNEVEAQYNNFKSLGLKLDMSRGKPSPQQLDLSMDMMNCLSADDYKSENGMDCRNYGILDGIPEAKRLFADMIDVNADEVIVFGNSSLNIMFWTIQTAFTHGILGSTPWGKLDKVKFLCPVPGYDRHFAICEFFGIEMINIPMSESGPDMDMIEKLVASDDSIKGIWCVPQYSNPQGICYSDETVKRFAALKPKAADFRIFWDNAYCVHHITDDTSRILSLLNEAKAVGNDNIAYIFGSTSKVTFSGSGVAVIGTSAENIASLKKALTVSTIGYDKINQLRHVRYFGNYDNILKHMNKHRELLEPRFNAVTETLEREITPCGEIGSWVKPKGGYFVSFNSMNGCAKRIVQLCAEAGVTLTNAGATFPYGKDPDDKNIRIAPSYPSIEELEKAMELFVICVKLASAEKLIAEM
ncbi:MAG: aminotransferase class I/II-fold pyridoxal phosphate-dependent enzyme [Ruminococcus sp.]|nr:aminotransferase class I/II-fold pyridoxal phosphate-dependent enzyme [Ruminococcus sp.]